MFRPIVKEQTRNSKRASKKAAYLKRGLPVQQEGVQTNGNYTEMGGVCQMLFGYAYTHAKKGPPRLVAPYKSCTQETGEGGKIKPKCNASSRSRFQVSR
jgi:hypothetical protein